MTDTTLAPTDAEILNEWDRVSCITFAGQRRLAFARAVLAKWGAPAPASGEAAARALLLDVKKRVNTVAVLPAAERREYAIRIKQDIADFLAAPPAQDVYKNSPAIDTSQKHVDPADMAQEARVPLSDDQIDEIHLANSDAYESGEVEYESHGFARAVEAAHGIGITAAQKEPPT